MDKRMVNGVELTGAAKKYKCIVPVSGGKDSQACLKMAVTEFGATNVLGLFCDTQFEHPKTYQHIRDMSHLYGVQIETICAGDVLNKSRKYNRFPGGGARHCTDELKIRPTRIYLKEYSEKFGGVQVWYGMRKIKAFEYDKFGEQQLIDVRIVELEINKSVFTAKVGQRWDDDNQGCRVCEI